ncbi:MAG: hypothetical protein COA85_12435 [Robiginitomaculum sp.]|nr:MAG: hypothetical protein COA85_12435 [Robiginitomaculum sp.]
MKRFRHIGPALVLLSLVACTSTSPNPGAGMGAHSAVAANIRTHSLAKGTLPPSTARMMLAISKYNKNETEPPVNMHTTDSVSAD